MDSGTNFAKIAIYGFSISFCSIALGLFYGAIVTFQGGETTNAILMVIAGLAFGAFGLGVFAMNRVGFRRVAREAELRSEHPDEPWKWRDDWATGRVRSTGKEAAWFFWVFAIIWNLISTPLVVFLPKEILEKGNYAALLGFLFPLVGIGLIIAAVRKTIQRGKFGDCLFIMERVPGFLGGDLKGTVLLPRGLQATETVTVRLSCIHKQRRRSGKDTTTTEDILWQTEQSVTGLSPTSEGGAGGATVKFRVPYDASPTSNIDEDNSIYWKLQASASVPGVDFGTEFEIPVFKTRDSSPQITEERLRAEEVSSHVHTAGTAEQTSVEVVPSAGGGTEFVIKPQGGLSTALSGMVFVIIFAGITAGLASAGAPFIFSLVFGFFTLFIALAIIFGAFGESRLIVEAGHVSVRNTLFGIMTGTRIPCSTITKISVKGDLQSGKRGSYSIVFAQQNGKSVSPFQSLRQRPDADWLAEELRKAMEPWRERSSQASAVRD